MTFYLFFSACSLVIALGINPVRLKLHIWSHLLWVAALIPIQTLLWVCPMCVVQTIAEFTYRIWDFLLLTLSFQCVCTLSGGPNCHWLLCLYPSFRKMANFSVEYQLVSSLCLQLLLSQKVQETLKWLHSDLSSFPKVSTPLQN